MADVNEHVAYLSQEIGPRPAGTEEEQRAALYISETLSGGANLPTTLEDFQCNPDSSLPRALLSGVALVVTVIALIFSALSLPALIIDFLCAALLAAEIFDKPLLSRFLNRGVSQNVVAKYVPLRSTNRSSRRRKVIIVANYDSGKIRRDLSGGILGVMPIIHWVEFAALVAMPVLLLIRLVTHLEGSGLAVMNGFIIALAVVTVLPVVSFVMEKLADYNEGANCNASGVAVMLDVAARVAAARDLPDMEEALIHGEEAAREAGLVPDGAELVYDAPSNTDELGSSMESASQRLAAAKAAVAALSGKPVTETAAEEGDPAPVAEEEAAADPSGAAVSAPAVPSAETALGAVEPVIAAAPVPAEPSVPDWFTKAQEQAKKPKVEKPVQRSRYAAALEHAEEEINARLTPQKSAAEELSERVRGMRASVQAASEAAGATPTGIMPPVEQPAPVEEPASESAAPAHAAPAAPVPDAAPQTATAEPAPASPSAVPAPEAVEGANAPAPLSVPVPPSLSQEIPMVQVAAAPTVADDPDISLREGQRPLTGATVVAPSSIPDLSGIPTPADGAVAEGGAPARRLMIPAVQEEATPAAAAADPAVPAGPAPRKRRAISLPKIGVSQELPRISMDDHLQAAPLAEERPASDGRVHDLSALIPAVGQGTPRQPIPEPSPAINQVNALRDSMPSLANVDGTVDPSLSGSISLAGSFSSMGATGAAAPIGDELLENTEPDEVYVEDVDDSAYREQVTETGAIAGPGYVEMPKSRFGRLFGRKRRKEKAQESTPQQWLNVDEDFEASQVGASRGGWESFRQDDEVPVGGQTQAFTPEYFDDAFNGDDEFASAPRPRRGRPFEGGAFSRDVPEGEEEPELEEIPEEAPEPTSIFGEGLPADFVFETPDEAQQIEQFRNRRVDVEVWFVALGSELAGNGGIRAFMEVHSTELKGSIIVDLEAMGAGQLSLIEKEGTYIPKKASSRMKRLAKKAGQAVGLTVPSATMEWTNSTAAYAMKHGQQAMHLAGMDGRKPALFAQADDVIENIDTEQLALHSDFVMELLKHI